MSKINKYINYQESRLFKIESCCVKKDFKVGIFVINLKHRTDKLELIENQFKNLKVSDYTVIDAVYGEKISNESIGDYADIDVFTNILGGKQLTKPEIGCSASHNEIYKRIIEENYSHAIVFEDDVIIKKLFTTFLKRLGQDTLDFYFDFLLMGYFGTGIGDTEVSAINKMIVDVPVLEFKEEARRGDRVWGTHAYVISNCGAQKMLDINDKIKFRADGPWNFFVEGLKLYAMDFKLARQRGRVNVQNDITERSPNIWSQ
jgi:GR25 family glycosyltransferase involved in LPS biosynthesis